MAKEITLNDAIRAIVQDVLAQQDGEPKWRQKEHGVAVAKAAMAFAVSYAKATPEEQAKITWKTFLASYKEHGFVGGNLSQFQQALDKLDADDDCHVTRPKQGAETDEYE